MSLQKKVIFSAVACLAVVIALTISLGSLALGSLPASDSAAAAQAAEIQDKLAAAGVQVTSIAIEGEKMTVVANKIDPEPVENAMESALQVIAVVRAAQDAGATWLDVTFLSNGQESSVGLSIRPPDYVARVSEEEAAAAVGEWIDQVESQSGVETTYSFSGYRVDIQAFGSAEALEKAADGFLWGTLHLHEDGQLDVSTVTARNAEGETVFVGVADWIAGMVGWPYTALGFHFGP